MRIPDLIKLCVCFLCVEDNGRNRYGGTAFLIQMTDRKISDLYHTYLVTARHCVEKAFSTYLNLSCRLNVEGQGARLISLPSPSVWALSETADVAVLPFPLRDDIDAVCLPTEMFLADNQIQEKAIGIGDELFVAGLFTQRHGMQRNIPIVRTGIIAAMPEEPLEDENTGKDYNAYLIEVRSIGGLSGSPPWHANFQRRLARLNSKNARSALPVSRSPL